MPFETRPQGHRSSTGPEADIPVKKCFPLREIRQNCGKVFITGFGPGDPDLLTVKALKTMQLADIIYYDDLINKAFITRFACEKVYVGKRKDNCSKTQDEINNLMYHSAIKGMSVVRLKGGDPCIFGRGGEEYDFLRERFIEVEIIPGISSAFAAAASIGLAFTQRGIASSVSFCTAHDTEKIPVPNTDTIVYYMGASNLKEIARKIKLSGRDPQTQVVLIQNVSVMDQKTIYTSLSEIENNPPEIGSPLLIIVGNLKRGTQADKWLNCQVPEMENQNLQEVY